MKYTTNKFDINHTWFTSDTHFYHKNIIKYCNRPFNNVEEMNETLINNWNSVVKKDDTVFHLGDMGFCGTQNLISVLSKLNGNIYLIRGNHDTDKQVSALFDNDLILCWNQYKSIVMIGDEDIPEQKLFLCHYPMIDWDNKERGCWMIHGHNHMLPDTPSHSPLHYDVGVDKNNYTPINFKTIKQSIIWNTKEN